MATSFSKTTQNYPKIRELIRPVFEMAEQSGMTAGVKEIEPFVERSAYCEEAFFTEVSGRD